MLAVPQWFCLDAPMINLFLLFQVFIPDYNVSVAELVIPGADLSQHLRFVNSQNADLMEPQLR